MPSSCRQQVLGGTFLYKYTSPGCDRTWSPIVIVSSHKTPRHQQMLAAAVLLYKYCPSMKWATQSNMKAPPQISRSDVCENFFELHTFQSEAFTFWYFPWKPCSKWSGIWIFKRDYINFHILVNMGQKWLYRYIVDYLELQPCYIKFKC